MGKFLFLSLIVFFSKSQAFCCQLNKKESEYLIQARKSLYLEQIIPSLSENQYGEKKRALIELAQRGIEKSKEKNAEEFVKICNPLREGRILSPKIGIYKKERNVFIEALVWEISLLLGCDRWICPSIPINIHGSLATFQPYYETTAFYERFIVEDSPLPLAISQENFWILTFFTLLIGHSDLNGTNITYNDKGYFLLDNDWAFPGENNPIIKNNSYLTVPIIVAWIDFLEANIPLQNDSLEKIEGIRQKWLEKEQDLISYFKYSYLCRELNPSQLDAFWERWKRILKTPIPSQASLRFWIQNIFPKYFINHRKTQQLVYQFSRYSCPTVRMMPKEKLGPMSILHFLGPCLKNRYKRYYECEQTREHVLDLLSWTQSLYPEFL